MSTNLNDVEVTTQSQLSLQSAVKTPSHLNVFYMKILFSVLLVFHFSLIMSEVPSYTELDRTVAELFKEYKRKYRFIIVSLFSCY